jgi:hypothetical protein
MTDKNKIRFHLSETYDDANTRYEQTLYFIKRRNRDFDSDHDTDVNKRNGSVLLSPQGFEKCRGQNVDKILDFCLKNGLLTTIPQDLIEYRSLHEDSYTFYLMPDELKLAKNMFGPSKYSVSREVSVK